MVWSLIMIICSIPLVDSSPDFTSEILRGANRARLSESRSPSASEPGNNACGLSSGEQHLAHKLDHVMPDLDQSHVTRIFEPNNNSLYVWEDDLSKSDTHFAWEAMNEMKRKRSEVIIIRQVNIIQVECSVLTKEVVSNRMLESIKNPSNSQCARHALVNHLQKLSGLLIGLFDLRKEKPLGPIRYIHRLDDELKWKILLEYIHKGIHELGYILINFRVYFDYLGKECIHALTAQVIGIINFFIRNNLLEGRFLEEWLKKKEIKKFLSTHIIDIFDESSFLDIDFQEALMKSRATAHLAFMLKYFTKDDLKLVEHGFLKEKVEFIRKGWTNGGIHIQPVANAFCNAGFEKSDVDLNQNDYEKIERKRREVLKDLVKQFHIITPFIDGTYSDPGSDYQYHTCGITYNMLCFAVRYHPQLVKTIIGDKEAIQEFNIKLKIMDSSIRYLRSARELQLIAGHGFWSSELSFSVSKHQITLEKAQNWIPEPINEVELYKKSFRCFVSKDFYEWKGIFKQSSLDRSKDLICESESILQIFRLDNPNFPFGTNFKLSTEITYDKSCTKSPFENCPMISELFLTDLSSWIERFKFTLEIHRVNKSIWEQIFTHLESEKDQSIPGTTRLNLRRWLKESDITNCMDNHIAAKYRYAKDKWNIIHQKMQLLKHNILSLMHKSHRRKYKLTGQDISEHGVGLRSLTEKSGNNLSIEKGILQGPLLIDIPNMQF